MDSGNVAQKSVNQLKRKCLIANSHRIERWCYNKPISWANWMTSTMIWNNTMIRSTNRDRKCRLQTLNSNGRLWTKLTTTQKKPKTFQMPIQTLRTQIRRKRKRSATKREREQRRLKKRRRNSPMWVNGKMNSIKPSPRRKTNLIQTTPTKNILTTISWIKKKEGPK